MVATNDEEQCHRPREETTSEAPTIGHCKLVALHHFLEIYKIIPKFVEISLAEFLECCKLLYFWGFKDLSRKSKFQILLLFRSEFHVCYHTKLWYFFNITDVKLGLLASELTQGVPPI